VTMSEPQVRITSLKWNPRSTTGPEEVVNDSGPVLGRTVPVEPVLLPVEEAARALGVGRTQFFVLLREGRIRSVKVGRRTLIPMSEVQRFAEELAREHHERKENQ